MAKLYLNASNPEKKRITSLILTGLLIFTFGIVVAFWVGINDSGWWQIPLYLSTAFSFLRVWQKFPWPDGPSSFLSFGGLLLLSSAVRRFLHISDFLLSGERFSDWPFYDPNPSWDTFIAEIIIVIGTFIALFSWSTFGGYKFSLKGIFSSQENQYRYTSYLIYSSSLGILFLNYALPLGKLFGQLSTAFIYLGYVAIFYIVKEIKSPSRKIIFSIILTLPFLIVSAASGMKANVIISFLPILLILWFELKSIYQRFIIILLLAIFLILNSGLSNYIRFNYWYKGESAQASSILGEYVEYLKTVDVSGFVDEEARSFLRRINSSYSYGYAVSIAETRGYQPDLVFSPLLYIFVPRLIWPGKPLVLSALEYNRMVFGSAHSSMDCGFFTGLFLGGGWFSLVLGSAFTGSLLAYLIKLPYTYGGTFYAETASVLLVPVILLLPQLWPAPAIAGCIILLLFVYVIIKFSAIITART